MAAPSLKELKARLDVALNNLVWWKKSLPVAGGWNKMFESFPTQTILGFL